MLDRRYINLEYILVKSQYIYEYVILQPAFVVHDLSW